MKTTFSLTTLTLLVFGFFAFLVKKKWMRETNSLDPLSSQRIITAFAGITTSCFPARKFSIALASCC